MFDWLCDKLIFGVIIIFIMYLIFVGWLIYEGSSSRVEQIINLAEGELISIHATGSFCIYDIELKFKDGTMILVTYSFSRRHNLKQGRKYKIWDSSFYGYQCKERK